MRNRFLINSVFSFISIFVWQKTNAVTPVQPTLNKLCTDYTSQLKTNLLEFDRNKGTWTEDIQSLRGHGIALNAFAELSKESECGLTVDNTLTLELSEEETNLSCSTLAEKLDDNFNLERSFITLQRMASLSPDGTDQDAQVGQTAQAAGFAATAQNYHIETAKYFSLLTSKAKDCDLVGKRL